MSSIPAGPDTAARNTPHLGTTAIHLRRVLVATDFSKPAAHALRVGAGVARLFGARLYLAHASEMLVFASPETGPLPVEVLNANLDAARACVQQLVDSDPNVQQLKPEIVVDYAQPVDLLQEIEQEEKIDLVVVGSHGATGLERIALGSVAEAVLRKSSCPVLVVGPHSRTEADLFCSILYATDLTPDSMRAAQYAAALAEFAQGKFTVLHVVDESSTRPFHKAQAIACDRSEKEQMEELLPADIRQHCKERVRVEYGDAGELITAVAREECASLVVVGLKDRSAFADRAPWSTLSHIIHDLPCPVLGVRSHLT